MGEKGRTLTQFVEKYPDKKAYFELSNDTMKFVFPEPGPMEGVKSRSKVILKMANVSFQYPTKDKPTIGRKPDGVADQPCGGDWRQRRRQIHGHQGPGWGA